MEQVATLLEHLEERLSLFDAIFVGSVVFVGVILIICWSDGALDGLVQKPISSTTGSALSDNVKVVLSGCWFGLIEMIWTAKLVGSLVCLIDTAKHHEISRIIDRVGALLGLTPSLILLGCVDILIASSSIPSPTLSRHPSSNGTHDRIICDIHDTLLCLIMIIGAHEILRLIIDVELLKHLCQQVNCLIL